MRTASTTARSPFLVRGEGAELARRKGSMGSERGSFGIAVGGAGHPCYNGRKLLWYRGMAHESRMDVARRTDREDHEGGYPDCAADFLHW